MSRTQHPLLRRVVLTVLPAPSLTSTDTFALRIQRSEFIRAVLMAGVYAAMIAITLVRRVTGGFVMASDALFWPYLGVLIAAIVYEIFAAAALRRALRDSRLIPSWCFTAGAVYELGIPAALLALNHWLSPRGAYAELSAPAILLFPMTILLSVLRLRPHISLGIGLGAAAFHGLLTADTIRTTGQGSDQYPVLFSYTILLALTGIAGMLVSRAARRYVAEAVEEAAALERAGRKLAAVERDLEVARQIQIGLLPSGPPTFPGFDIAGMNMPADQTGGDYYDWQALPNGRLLVVMADVTGHGIGPALVMAVCRAYARASAPMDMEPVSLMGRLNDLLHADVTGGRFITLAMAVLDTSGAVELVSAGHGPTLLFRASTRTIEQFGGDGLPLAITGNEHYGPSRRFTMDRSDVLVMLTDGVMEWQNGTSEQFGSGRLAAALTESASRSAAEIVDHVHRTVLAFAAGAPQNDDVTIVAIKRG